MKKLLFLLLVFFLNINTFAGTCSSISYTSSSANSTLTSTKYNTDNSTVYNFVNAYDAGCITSGTLEKDALDTSVATGFAVPLNGIVSGCKVTKDTDSTLIISQCMASVNNNWVKTATTTAVAWTDLDTGAEAASTYYYVYIDSLSSGTTLTPVISVTAPGNDGFNGSDRVIARFYNDADSDIITNVSQWHTNAFERDKIFAKYGATTGNSLPDADSTVILYDSKEIDTHGAVSYTNFATEDWVFTAPLAGTYTIHAKASINDSGFTLGDQMALRLRRGGAFKEVLDSYEPVSSDASGANVLRTFEGTTIVTLTKGQTIAIAFRNDAGVAIDYETGGTWVSVVFEGE